MAKVTKSITSLRVQLKQCQEENDLLWKHKMLSKKTIPLLGTFLVLTPLDRFFESSRSAR